MDDQNKQDLIQEVLKYINLARVAMELPELLDLPKGIRNDTGSCPLARCLNAIVTGDCVSVGNSNDRDKIAMVWGVTILNGCGDIPLPHPLQEFVGWFDVANLPEYDLSPEPDEPDQYEPDEPEPEKLDQVSVERGLDRAVKVAELLNDQLDDLLETEDENA